MPNSLQSQAEALHQRVRAYLPDLLMRLAQTVGLPLFAALLLATAGGVLLAQFIPSSTTTILLTGLNIVVIYQGWRWFERRLKAISLFIVYSAYSKERRALLALLSSKVGSADVQAQWRACQDTAQAFIDAMQQAGAKAAQI
ncbi:MAG: hypothetical protein NZ750_09780 [Anaerolineae bacterium]|nr:hypothetical protein [Anaerolineae bacterium]MDW8171910.1 hypothetical protein [Anaerolineae bacterium]